MTAKPVQIQRYRPHSECRNIPAFGGMQHGSRLDEDDTGPAVLHSDHQAALLQVREMLEAKAREWRANACGVDAPRTDCGYTKCASELLALAATLGEPGEMK